MNAPQMLLSEVVQRTLPHPGAAVQVRLDTHRARAVIVSISAILGAVLHRKQGERPNMPPNPPRARGFWPSIRTSVIRNNDQKKLPIPTA